MVLDLFVDGDQPRRTTAALYEQLRDAITTGRLSPGDRLPTSRELAADLGVARSTITTVYGRLVAEGFAQARTGDGTFVAQQRSGRRRPERSPTALRIRRPVAEPAQEPMPATPRIDLRTGRPDPRLFPLADWRRAAVDALQVPPPGYGHPAGLPELRRALAAWMGRSRGVEAGEDQVLVTAGAQQAFDLCARVLVGPGEVVAMEDPGYEPARRAFAHHGARVEPVPVDDEGMVVARLPRSARLVYVTPSHQLPTGVTMTQARRHELLDAAARQGAAVLEDDYDSEHRYVDRPLEPLQRLDRAGRVVYVGTFSKTLSPSIRIGFVVAPEPVLTALVHARNVADSQPPHLTQAALAGLLGSGRFARHLRRTHRIYAARQAVVAVRVAGLHEAGLVPRVWPSHAGMHTMVELPPGTDARAVAAALGAQGIAVGTADLHSISERRPALLVGYGLATPDELHTAFDALAQVLAAPPRRRTPSASRRGRGR